MMPVTKTLMDEHRLIEQVLGCLDRMADRCESVGRLDARPARDAVWFLRTFADRCHHGKEEAQLFPLMEQRGFSPSAGPVAVMRKEHDDGRRLVDEIERTIDGAAGGEARAVEDFARHARSFVALLRDHIRKEDHCLFPMAEQALTANDRAMLARRFEQVDADEIGQEVLEQCRVKADALADEYGVPRAGAVTA